MARARLSITLWATRMGVHAEDAGLDGLAGREQPQVRVDAALAQPAAREAEGEPAPVDRRVGRGFDREGEARRCGPRARA